MKLELVPTNRLGKLIKALQSEGWQKVHEYPRVDSWIDHGSVTFENRGRQIRCEWTQWDEGRIEGPEAILHSLECYLKTVGRN